MGIVFFFFFFFVNLCCREKNLFKSLHGNLVIFFWSWFLYGFFFSCCGSHPPPVDICIAKFCCLVSLVRKYILVFKENKNNDSLLVVGKLNLKAALNNDTNLIL